MADRDEGRRTGQDEAPRREQNADEARRRDPPRRDAPRAPDRERDPLAGTGLDEDTLDKDEIGA